jgi:hypothetical protein
MILKSLYNRSDTYVNLMNRHNICYNMGLIKLFVYLQYLFISSSIYYKINSSRYGRNKAQEVQPSNHDKKRNLI